MDSPKLSVVIPAYNEEASIVNTLQDIANYLTSQNLSHEIIVADDGSTDRTIEVVRQLGKGISSISVLVLRHSGKGAAIKHGMLAARGMYALFMDADHSTRIEEIQRCMPFLEDGSDMVIGSRKMPGSIVKVHQTFLRETMGRGFTWVTNAMLGIDVSDITCGFKCFRINAARDIFGCQKISGWGFDAEILFIARLKGYKIKEVPITWTNDASTKVRLFKDTIRSMMELIQIRTAALKGRYSSCENSSKKS